ncbi:MAG: HEAT repeat domain-containing protein [Spirochaeta sp.]|jgi:HEAT repeat protein|nr:HEAT repeat domain-containing protein [Spirochaeta sp.]
MRYIAVVLLVLIVLPVFSQDGEENADAQTERTIEELYLSQDLELQIMRSQALANDREMKRLAMQNIRSMVENGQPSEGVYVILESLATEGVARQVRSNGAVINNFPEIRREATELLGRVGGEQAKNTLLRIVRDDPEPMVLSEAAYALGQIGLNENNEVSDYLVQTLMRENSSPTPDNNLAFSIIISLERLSAQNGGLADPEALGALLETASSPYIRTVRRRAVEAIVNMREHG